MQTQPANVADPGNAATGDHRYISRARQIDGRFDIAPFKESVASDIGEEQGRHASIPEPARLIGHGHEFGRPPCAERAWQYDETTVVRAYIQKKINTIR